MFKPLILILVGLVYALFSAKGMLDDRSLAQRGKSATIQPLEKYTKETKKSSHLVSYKADLTFETESGEKVTVTRTLPDGLLQQLTSGEEVQIRYLPDNPTVARLSHEGQGRGADIGVGVLVLAFGIFWFRRTLNAPVARNT